MIWFKKQKINVIKKAFPELKAVSVKDNKVTCKTPSGTINVSNDFAPSLWDSQFIADDKNYISIPETSRSLVQSIRKSLHLGKTYLSSIKSHTEN